MKNAHKRVRMKEKYAKKEFALTSRIEQKKIDGMKPNQTL